jgi:ParB/RepB/Spo0J family partition protein
MATSNVLLIDPHKIRANKENPRLIFREDELQDLEKSIQEQGILVPLTVFAEGQRFTLLDGERRWRCATKLALKHVPVIVQPKPDLLQNIMMMFAIHKARRDWDPLPTALKLEELEKVLHKRLRRRPTESELASSASLSRGEVRRYRKILGLPTKYKTELLKELEKPRSDQRLTVDHVLEAVKGADALRKSGVVDVEITEKLTDAIVKKFQAGVLNSTVEPRLLPRIARAVHRGQLSRQSARKVVYRLINQTSYTIEAAYQDSTEETDFHHAIEQSGQKLGEKLDRLIESGSKIDDDLRIALSDLLAKIKRILSDSGP